MSEWPKTCVLYCEYSLTNKQNRMMQHRIQSNETQVYINAQHTRDSTLERHSVICSPRPILHSNTNHKRPQETRSLISTRNSPAGGWVWNEDKRKRQLQSVCMRRGLGRIIPTGVSGVLFLARVLCVNLCLFVCLRAWVSPSVCVWVSGVCC